MTSARWETVSAREARLRASAAIGMATTHLCVGLRPWQEATAEIIAPLTSQIPRAQAAVTFDSRVGVWVVCVVMLMRIFILNVCIARPCPRRSLLPMARWTFVA